MGTHVKPALILASFLIFIEPALSEVTAKDANSESSIAERENNLKEMRSEFRELIIDSVVSDVIGSDLSLIRIARKNKFVDPRFDAIAKRLPGLLNQEDLDSWLIQHSVYVIPLSTLTKREKVMLLLRAKMHPSIRRLGSTLREIDRQLKEEQAILATCLVEILNAREQPLSSALRCLSLVEWNPKELLPVLLEIAHEEDAEAADLALIYLDSLLNREQLVIAQMREPKKEIPAGYFKAAERVMARYDDNHDGVLTENEWSSMLHSPAKADSDRDGKITLNEYAYWMRNR
ncbi:MAG: EF-hand domain-containing protein [Planctomycetota bacterium]